jgi:hypothetical protein
MVSHCKGKKELLKNTKVKKQYMTLIHVLEKSLVREEDTNRTPVRTQHRVHKYEVPAGSSRSFRQKGADAEIVKEKHFMADACGIERY